MVVITQILLNEIATKVSDDFINTVTVGTGDDAIALTTTDLETPVQIGAADRNKADESAEATLTDNFFTKKFKLNAVEPNSLPVNLSEVGIQDTLTSTNLLKAGFIFASSTKDNQSQWVIRFNGRVVEGSSSESCGN